MNADYFKRKQKKLKEIYFKQIQAKMKKQKEYYSTLHRENKKEIAWNLHQYFTTIIGEILFFCEQLELTNENKVLIKYQKMKKDINDSSNPDQYVRNLAIRYKKWQFKPVLFLENQNY
ncbi:35785_t:CDS:2 [Gigaspora margarita]|uniref:35785_t:CDS:1 n=1 Tax=Gigaspora margarita TaxID=4874 RepID=A0ABN7WHF2_GIGMA|nr:35785_t:CDS:2 [Gigaspora margarita]